MATYVLIHGAGSTAWDWHLVAPELRKRGHDTVAMDLPCEDESAGLPEYVDTVVDAIGDRQGDLVVVAHSLGGFTAPLVCARVPARLLVLVAAMVPRSGETGIEWWANTRHNEAVPEDEYRGDDDMTVYFHDVPPDLAAEALARSRGQTSASMLAPWPLDRWPDVPTRYILCRGDRMFPAGWNRRVVRERLGIDPDEMNGGHLPYLSRPKELADRLDAYWRAQR
jgi:pimeloyl-ACP methyl ester carboxylesterase